MNENKLKHLELIQGIITRMGGNLFYLRGWVITLVAGMLALLTQLNNSELPIIFLTIILLIFWIYDGYFLAQERSYRDLYNETRKKKDEDIDFSMNITEYKKYKKNSLAYCMFSETLFFFYTPILIAALYLIFNT